MPECHVDQSGRTDVLTVATALALADDLRCSVLIPAAVKRACAEALRARSVRKRLIGVRMFAAGLVLLLEQCAQPQPVVVIDLEYVGWDGEIKGHVLHRL